MHRWDGIKMDEDDEVPLNDATGEREKSETCRNVRVRICETFYECGRVVIW